MHVELKPATFADLPILLPYVKAFHKLEHISMEDGQREAAILPLLGANEKGRIWMIEANGERVGYIVLGFGYSIEFGGRDAFIDEFFIRTASRGQGIGRTVLALVKVEAIKAGVKALHLEVLRSNDQARRLYEHAGFAGRDRYVLMSYDLLPLPLTGSGSTTV